MAYSNADRSLEELARYYSWDAALSELLRPLPRRLIERFVAESFYYDRDGWQYILPKLPPSGRVLCLDARFGYTAAVLAESDADVTVIHPSAGIVDLIRYRLAAREIRDVQVICVPETVSQLPFEAGSFDAFICHDVAGTLSATGNAGPLGYPVAILAAELQRVLKPGGFAYFGLKNRYSYRQVRDLMRQPWSADRQPDSVQARRFAQVLLQAGFRRQQGYSFMVEKGLVNEVLPSAGYRSAKNSLLASEKLKEILLGETGSRHFAPAFGLVCARDTLPPSRVQELAKHLEAQQVLRKPPGDPAGFFRYLPIPGKIFVTFDGAADGNENIIAVIPQFTNIASWRRNEIGIVNEVRALSPFLASRVPRLYFEGSWGGETYFAMSEICGFTVDRYVRQLQRLTRNAADFLIRFNQITAREHVIDEDRYDSLIGGLVADTAKAYPEVRELLGKIERRLRKNVLGKSLRLVWFHGDYKLENLIIDRASLDIAGIIDWEQSRREFFPWLDMFFLLIYNRVMVEDRNFFSIYHEVVLAGNFTQPEAFLLETYAAAVPVSQEWKEVLMSVLFIHHICCRYKYNMTVEGDRNGITCGLEEIDRRLARLTS